LHKGEKVNKARVATLITQEKACREEAKVMKSGFAYLFGEVARGKGFSKFDYKFYKSEYPTRLIVLIEKHQSICMVFHP
jgi:hypothetical protein